MEPTIIPCRTAGCGGRAEYPRTLCRVCASMANIEARARLARAAYCSGAADRRHAWLVGVEIAVWSDNFYDTHNAAGANHVWILCENCGQARLVPREAGEAFRRPSKAVA